MKCNCGRYLTQQTRVVAKIHQLDGTECLFCMAARLNVLYQSLLDEFQGIYDCRECTKKTKADERRRRLGL